MQSKIISYYDKRKTLRVGCIFKYKEVYFEMLFY